jgi:hypothetical protein
MQYATSTIAADVVYKHTKNYGKRVKDEIINEMKKQQERFFL